jgi:DNA-binding MarR family transcriptional regulator
VTAVIDRLERAGYARRVGDPKDRRRVLVELTPLARERAEVIWGPYSFFQEMLGGYTIEQLELLLDFHRVGREFTSAARPRSAACASTIRARARSDAR